MKRIKSYKAFESLSDLNDIEGECDDILIAVRDDRMNTTVESNTSVRYGTQRIDVFIDPRPEEGSRIDLSGQAETLERLMRYLESEGFRLAAGRYESSRSHNVCPSCGSEEIKSRGYDEPTDEFFSECLDCAHRDQDDSFSSSYWSISGQDELMSAIKSKIYMLELEFDRKI
jgi:hypothetical protein